jgi:hypothetical protein
MIGWWEADRFAEVRLQEHLREAEQERLKRHARDADAGQPALLQLAVDRLTRRSLSPLRRCQGRDYANAEVGKSSGPPVSLIL